MFENMNEQQARDAILESVKEYCDLYHKKPDYMEGDRIPYASRVDRKSTRLNSSH